jgi:hypothetical protein
VDRGARDQCIEFGGRKMRLHMLRGDEHLVGLHAHRHMTARVATGPARNRRLGLGRSRRERPVELLVGTGNHRKQVGGIARFAQALEQRTAGLFEQGVFFR